MCFGILPITMQKLKCMPLVFQFHHCFYQYATIAAVPMPILATPKPKLEKREVCNAYIAHGCVTLINLKKIPGLTCLEYSNRLVCTICLLFSLCPTVRIYLVSNLGDPDHITMFGWSENWCYLFFLFGYFISNLLLSTFEI